MFKTKNAWAFKCNSIELSKTMTNNCKTSKKKKEEKLSLFYTKKDSSSSLEL